MNRSMIRRRHELAAGKTRVPMEKFLLVFEILMMNIKLQNARAIEILSRIRRFAISLDLDV